MGPASSTSAHTNVFNVLNKNDYFTHIPPIVLPFISPSSDPYDWGRHGLDGRFSMDETQKINITPSHEMSTYMRWMETMGEANLF